MSSFHFNFNFRSYVADLMCPVSHSCITVTSFESEIFHLDHLSHISYLIGGFWLDCLYHTTDFLFVNRFFEIFSYLSYWFSRFTGFWLLKRLKKPIFKPFF